jgi:hypothetical protein
VRSARSPLTAGSIARIQLASHEHMTVVTSLAVMGGGGIDLREARFAER